MSSRADLLPEGTHIMVDENGKYLWRGTIEVRENPTMAILIAKTMGVVLGATVAIFIGIGIFCHFSLDDWLMMLAIGGGCILIVIGISVAVTWLYLRSLAGTYSADYVMDETGVLFRPAPREQDLNRDVATGVALLSAMAGNLGVTSASLAAMNSDAVSVFSTVRRVKGIRSHCCIKVSGLLLYNQVYVAPEDYDFVYRFISSRCPKARCVEV